MDYNIKVSYKDKISILIVKNMDDKDKAINYLKEWLWLFGGINVDEMQILEIKENDGNE